MTANGTLLQLDKVRKTFGGLVAVNDVSFNVERGDVLGLIGPNGSGKTTVMNLISGGLRPDSGEIRLKGALISNKPAFRVARAGIGRTFQLVRLVQEMTVLENAAVGLAFTDNPVWGQKAVNLGREALAMVGLTGMDDLPASALTYIDQKRLELARALALKPELLLLDEWLAGLNATELGTGIALIRKLGREGTTIVMVEHVMSAINTLCNRCVVMNAGQKLAEGTPKSVLSDQAVIDAYLGDSHA
ncbi:MAG TPA: ABC transporter ATP-binding protein [Xanthobacteraceae bacterium]|nr:ABC transporter ATP-binding protein [Xanthobacteraceae bacterium]